MHANISECTLYIYISISSKIIFVYLYALIIQEMSGIFQPKIKRKNWEIYEQNWAYF